jgi:hypothetical protein
MATYPEKFSDVTVIFTTGEVKKYRINAGSGIARYLAEQASARGILTLLNGRDAYSIPLAQIAEYHIHELTEEELAAELTAPKKATKKGKS